jgi:hypothetical protein
MAEKSRPEVSAEVVSTANISQLEGARVSLTGEEHLRIEFNIQDLIKRLLPGSAVGHCGGCDACMGCSM